MTDWFRSWHGAPTDPKWLGIARKAGVAPGIAVAIGWALMDRASQAADRGSIEGYDADGLAYFFGCEPEQVDAVVEAMRSMRSNPMLDGDRFAAWDRRQPKREDGSPERAKAWRERNRTQPNAQERPETDTEEETDTESEEESPPPARESDAALCKFALNEWNILADELGLPLAKSLTAARKAAIPRRIAEAGGVEGFAEALAKIRGSPFLRGQEKNWSADFDFVLQAKSFTKLREGGYDPRKPKGQHGGGDGAAPLTAGQRQREIQLAAARAASARFGGGGSAVWPGGGGAEPDR